jgi:hypothetical protein
MSHEDFSNPLCPSDKQPFLNSSIEVSIPKNFKYESVYYNYTTSFPQAKWENVNVSSTYNSIITTWEYNSKNVTMSYNGTTGKYVGYIGGMCIS